MNERDLFGPASGCQSFSDLVSLQRHAIGQDAQRAIAAYAMLFCARGAPKGEYRENALSALDCLGTAKMELDKSSCHTAPTVLVTAEILSEAQKFVDEMTIPCTKWPTSDEVVSFVLEIAKKHAYAGPWRRTRIGIHGQVIGVEEFDSV